MYKYPCPISWVCQPRPQPPGRSHDSWEDLNCLHTPLLCPSSSDRWWSKPWILGDPHPGILNHDLTNNNCWKMENKIPPIENWWRKYELWRYNLKFNSYKGLSASVTMCTLVAPKSVLGPDPFHFSYLSNCMLDKLNLLQVPQTHYYPVYFFSKPQNLKT